MDARIVLSADELEILSYLKSWNGKFITLIQICRSAGNRQKFRESPNWANSLMNRLVDLSLVEVNERGHYRWIDDNVAPGVVGDDYFPEVAAPEQATPTPPPPAPAAKPSTAKRTIWITPHYSSILQKSGKKLPK